MARRELVYVDIGVFNARDWWDKIVIPAFEAFQKDPSAQTTMALASSLWHIHEWVWYDHHPDTNTRDSKEYKEFCSKIIAECPELEWIRDLTDIGKHRALTRRASSDISIVKQTETVGRGGAGGYGVSAPMAYGSGIPQFALLLQDSSCHWLGDVYKRVFDYWKYQFP